jgi:type I restriction enzyme M protein
MQDDFYELAADGWKAGNEVKRIRKKTKKGDKEVVKEVAGIEGLEGILIPPALIIQEYFARERKALDEMEAQAETLNAEMDELREEHGGEDGLLEEAMDDKQKISKKNLQTAIKDIGKRTADNAEEYDMLHKYKKLMEEEAEVKAKIKAALAELEKKVIAQYPKLTIDEIKNIVVEKKWMAEMQKRISTEMDNISQCLTQRIKELAERYETPLPQLNKNVDELTAKVETHLRKMNFKW